MFEEQGAGGQEPAAPEVSLDEIRRKLEDGEELTEEEKAVAVEAALLVPSPEGLARPEDHGPPEAAPPAAEEQPAAPAEAEAAAEPEAAPYVDPFDALKELPVEERLERLERLQAKHAQEWLEVIAEIGRATGREDAINAILHRKVKPAPPEPETPAE